MSVVSLKSTHMYMYFYDRSETLSAKTSTEYAQFEQSNKVAIETLQRERDELQSHLQQRLQENEQLTK